ncbi:MAG: hypothetical protein KKF22_16050 [Gammaproteobacteria bacterium]|nr:hypothetical protein [Gammaproteobacteria bacterium]
MAECKVEHKKQQSSGHDAVSQRKGATALPDHRSQVSQAHALSDNRTVQLAADPQDPLAQMQQNVNINNDSVLEQEADVMGSKALSASTTQMKQSSVRISARITPAVNTKSTLQLQKANGWYRLSKAGNLRNENADHTVQRNLPINTIVKVIDKGVRVSNFKAGWVTNEHSWSKIPLQNQIGWLEDSKLSNAARVGQTPHNEFLGSIGAGRTDYHFGLNGAGGVDPLGHRMDYIREIDAGTVAEYDWRNVGALPAHIVAADHTRLSGGLHQGDVIAPLDGTDDPTRVAAATFKNPATVLPVEPILATNYEKYTFHRKTHNSSQAHDQIHTHVNYEDEVHPGVDFSKSALIDQLVQHKQIHFHLSGMQSRWKGAAAADMTGADFVEVVTKAGAYEAGGNMKDHVTFRELRFVWRYWTRNLRIPNDAGVPTNYTFNGHVTFYFNGSKVRPPWLWGAADNGASPASRA